MNISHSLLVLTACMMRILRTKELTSKDPLSLPTPSASRILFRPAPTSQETSELTSSNQQSDIPPSVLDSSSDSKTLSPFRTDTPRATPNPPPPSTRKYSRFTLIFNTVNNRRFDFDFFLSPTLTTLATFETDMFSLLDTLVDDLSWAYSTPQLYMDLQPTSFISTIRVTNSSSLTPPKVTLDDNGLTVQRPQLKDPAEQPHATIKDKVRMEQRIWFLENVLSHNVNSTLLYLNTSLLTQPFEVLKQNISRTCDFLQVRKASVGTVVIKELGLRSDYRVFETVVCGFESANTTRERMVGIITNFTLKGTLPNKDTFVKDDIVDPVLPIIQQKVSVVRVTNLPDSQALISIQNYLEPLKNFNPKQEVVSPIPNNETDSVQTLTITANTLAVAFQVPTNVGQIVAEVDDNCQMPLFLIGRNFQPTLIKNSIDRNTVYATASATGFSPLLFPLNSPVELRNFANRLPRVFQEGLAVQLINIDNWDLTDTAYALVSCLYLKNTTVGSSQVKLLFEQKVFGSGVQVAQVGNRKTITTFLRPDGTEQVTLPANEYPQLITWDWAGYQNVTMIIQYTPKLNGSALLVANQESAEEYSEQHVLNRSNSKVDPKDARKGYFNLVPIQRGHITIHNMNPAASLRFSVVLTSIVPPSTAYIGITIGVVLGVACLSAIILAGFLIHRRRNEISITNRLFPFRTDEILMNEGNSYLGLGEFMFSGERKIESTRRIYESKQMSNISKTDMKGSTNEGGAYVVSLDLDTELDRAKLKAFSEGDARQRDPQRTHDERGFNFLGRYDLNSK
jgi:hypothetical protein